MHGDTQLIVLLGLGKLHLHTVDTVDTVDEEDEDEDERDLDSISKGQSHGLPEAAAYFHPILKLGHDGALGDEVEQLALHRIW